MNDGDKSIESHLKEISDGIQEANKKLDKLSDCLQEDTVPEYSNTDEKYLSVKEVSTLVGLSERTIYRRFYEGKLKSFKMGGLRVFALSDVSKFVQAEREAGNFKGDDSGKVLGKLLGE